MAICWCGLFRSRDKLKTYLHYHNAYDHKTWQDHDSHWVFLPIKSHVHISTWSCKITWKTKIIIYSLSQCLWLSILVGIYNEELPSIKSADHYHKAYAYLTWQSGDLLLPWCRNDPLITWSSDFDFPYTICRFRTQTPNSSSNSCCVCL